ncbi:MAG: ribosome biogenesis GTPase Der [Desulfurella sp.]|uniref:ribosome biogenesis GTPase Der n=1 Tax=Desulfurella sp. TaxID=1962857 RepID=UPI003D10B94A
MIVSIVGRPNVGKSSLFNLLIGKNKSIISDIPGTTRDRIADYMYIKDKSAMLIDTGGLNDEDYALSKKINLQTQAAIESSDIVILVFDAKEPLNDFDISLFKMIAKLKKKYIVVVNKIDEKNEEFFYDYIRFKNAIFISTKRRTNLNILKERLYELIEKNVKIEDANTRLAIVGRTNVGKSSLFNAILRKERSIVDNNAGTTRDSVETLIKYHEKTYKIIDTAGLRLKLKKESLDKLASYLTLFSIERCDIALFVIDASQGVTTQDLKIASILERKHKGIIVLFNKWDLVEKDAEKVFKDLKNRLSFINFVPFLKVSAKESKNIDKIFKYVSIVEEYYNKRVSTHNLNEAFRFLSAKHHAVSVNSKPIRIKFINQVDIKPPTFVIFTNVKKVPKNYEHFIKNQLYSMFKFTGCPLKLIFKND